ncbi:MAG TPA: DUF3025 domain-containing protein, partial [Burkholderiaceae bacterium]|nr:DUF3025 domain-containing protein [Burkholderiaceae bacterium]
IPSWLGSIDWHAPWLSGLTIIAAPILQAENWRDAFNAAAQAQQLCNHRDLPLRFVAQEELPADMAYEEFISASGCVPTRDNLHDFFNALVWLAYPNVKKQLNALQAAEIQQSGLARGRLRDATTIFDENAALFVCADPQMIAALRAHRWDELFIQRRAAFSDLCRVHLFGHALMEKLTNPYKAITAHTWIVEVEPAFLRLPTQVQRSELDRIVSLQLVQGLTTSSFTPLPVLGIPDWWPQQDAVFYADPSVFRPKRST